MTIPKLETPTDELTGLPLPILPQEVLPHGDLAKANWHHQWHPGPEPVLRSPLALTDYGVRGLRGSRVQLVSRADHDLYHDFFDGPPWPETNQDRFDLCVLGVAGYIPPEAIDLSGDSPKPIPMRAEQLAILRTMPQPVTLTRAKAASLRTKAFSRYRHNLKATQRIKVKEEDYLEQCLEDYVDHETRRTAFMYHHLAHEELKVQNFFREFVMAQEVRHIPEVVTEEFLLTSEPERERFLGHLMLDDQIYAAVEGVKPLYVELRQAGSLHPRMPLEPALLVRDKLSKMPDIARGLKEALAAKARLET